MSKSGGATPTPAVALVGALDTKAQEYAFVRDRLSAAGLPTLLVDTGVLTEPGVTPDINRHAVAAAAHRRVQDLAGRNDAVSVMAEGAARLVAQHHANGLVGAVIVLGGSNAGHVMSRVAASLPYGCPKVLVSTIVAGDTRPYVGTSDLIMMYPVVDIAGLNSVSVPILAKAADAVIGMLRGAPLPLDVAQITDRRSVGCTMFGVTTDCVSAVQQGLTQQGLEVLVFHATGTGGRTFEAMIASGAFEAVADITTTELADDLLHGVCSAGPHRLEAATRHGVPQVVSVGALDMVNFGPRETVPQQFTDRQLLAHNPSITLMRTSAPENAELGRRLARKLNPAEGFVEVHVPIRGFSQISIQGGPFYDPDADRALVDALRQHLAPHIPLHLQDLAINDREFADVVLAALGRGLSLSTKGRDANVHAY